MGDLTEHFSIAEFLVSKEHPDLLAYLREGITETDKLKMFYLARCYLEPLREVAGVPITILSGKRSLSLNRAVKGAQDSDHLYHAECGAVDFTYPGIGELLFVDFFRYLPIGQVIWYPDQRFFHISLASKKHFGEKLVKQDGIFKPYP